MRVEGRDIIENQPLLTIAIPTFNRSAYLDCCLRRIVEEIEQLEENQRPLIRVYVSDNGSTDDTSKVISRYQEMYSCYFESERNEKNMGMDYNFTKCYESAKTPYIWLMGDDDVILPEGLKNVLIILSNNKIDLLYVNNYWFKDQYKEKLKIKEKLTFTKFNSSLEFSRQTHVMLTFLSGLIVRSSVGISYRNILVNSCLVQLSWVLPLLRDGNCFVVIENETVAAKGGNSGGYSLVDVFGTNLKRITDEILKSKPLIAKAIQNGTIVKFFPGLVMAFRNGSDRFSDNEMAAGLKKVFGNNWRYYIFIAPLISLPLYISRVYYYFARLLAKLLGPFVI